MNRIIATYEKNGAHWPTELAKYAKWRAELDASGLPLTVDGFRSGRPELTHPGDLLLRHNDSMGQFALITKEGFMIVGWFDDQYGGYELSELAHVRRSASLKFDTMAEAKAFLGLDQVKPDWSAEDILMREG